MNMVWKKVLILGVLMLGLSSMAFAFDSDVRSGASTNVGLTDSNDSASASASVRPRPMLVSEKMRTMMETYRERIQANVTGDARFHRCEQFTNSSQRENCFTREGGIGDLARQKIKCETEGTNRSACVQDLKDHVRTVWTWRFEHLIQMAENLNVSADLQADVDSFKAFVQAEAVAFDNATTPAEKRQIVKDVVAAWKDLRAKILREMVEAKLGKATAGLQHALDVLNGIRTKLQARNQSTPGLDNAISKLEENLAKLNASSNLTLSQRWMVASMSIARVQFAKRSIMRMMNHQPTEEFREQQVSVPEEVVEAEGSANASADAEEAS